MSYELDLQSEVEAAASSLTSTADIHVWTPSFPAEIYEFGVVITTSLTASDNLIIAGDLRITAASDTGRGTADIGTITIAAADSGDIDTGDVIMCRLETPVVILPGQQMVVEVTNACTAGDGYVFINYRKLARGDRSVVTVGGTA